MSVDDLDGGASGAVDSYSNARCAAIYDVFEGPDRYDLDVYAAMVDEFGAASVLDVGCGTGAFASMLAVRGVEVVGVDPSALALDVAKSKPGAERVTWVHGTAPDVPPLQVDMAFMTANVAQVFLGDEDWSETLRAIHGCLREGGRLVFESRRPERKAWEDWTKATTHCRAEVEGEGPVESWVQLESVDGEYVRFVGVTVFESDGARVEERSTLRFRSRDDLTSSLEREGFVVDEIRDAPDRPGREFVFIARAV
ncbi:class I SAM-dependent methyltransferase [Brevibacterium oceani]|uniref:class I SAM-dependent methyltransferase n=1 Tax=Brevibacterium oceani TaxID=358099 RepID=UPI001B31A4CF|nr:class I SAM-dependent methyltransferase [Brevibacterium oceani]